MDQADKENSMNPLRNYDYLLEQTIALIRTYKQNGIKIPGSLKGNLGEFIVSLELIKRNNKVDFLGGTYPGFDLIANDNIKIQVKTQIRHKPRIYKHGSYEFESSPTINRDTIEGNECDIIALVIINEIDDIPQLENYKSYIFDRSQFKYFSPIGCWSGKSKNDYTIFNIIQSTGKIPNSGKRILDQYDNAGYKDLFKISLNAWYKIDKKA